MSTKSRTDLRLFSHVYIEKGVPNNLAEYMYEVVFYCRNAFKKGECGL